MCKSTRFFVKILFTEGILRIFEMAKIPEIPIKMMEIPQKSHQFLKSPPFTYLILFFLHLFL